MIPPPGYSINDLITVAGWAKNVYQTFFHEYKSADAQLGDLAEEIASFEKRLATYRRNLEARGLEDHGHEAIRRTLEQCVKLLEDYKETRKNTRKKSFIGRTTSIVKTTLFATEATELQRLRSLLNSHKHDIVVDGMNLVVDDMNVLLSEQYQRQRVEIPALDRTLLSDICEDVSTSLVAPLDPIVKETAVHDSGVFTPSSPPACQPSMPSPKFTFDRRASPTFPSTSPQANRRTSGSQYLASTPSPKSTAENLQSSSIPDLSLPEPALKLKSPAHVFYGPGNKDYIIFTRLPLGADYDRGRKIEIRDDDGKRLFGHKIKVGTDKPCHPYTWHSSTKDIVPLCVTFKDYPTKHHWISLNGASSSQAKVTPKYVFTDQKDFMEFQRQVRGKILEGVFEIREVTSDSSGRNGEATNQHLKIWRDPFSKECSLSFYASTAKDAQHLEFPFDMFAPEVTFDEESNVRLDFVAAARPKKARTHSKAFSSSETETSTIAPRIFSRTNTAVVSSASSITTAPSRMSVASFDSGQTQSGSKSNAQSLETQAKRMKYLDFEFSDKSGQGQAVYSQNMPPPSEKDISEAQRFINLFNRLCNEQATIPLDKGIEEWQKTTRGARPESVISSSTSPYGTPYTRSPEMKPQTQSPASTPRTYSSGQMSPQYNARPPSMRSPVLRANQFPPEFR